MARTNKKKDPTPVLTAPGAKAVHISPRDQLRRSVLTYLLWEDNFYEDGVTIAERIKKLIREVAPDEVAKIAIEAREKSKLRHVPLFMVRAMAELAPIYKRPSIISETLARVIQRPDELAEFVALYWKDRKPDEKRPLSNQVKIGLRNAFTKFDAYQLAKYNRKDAEVRLRDVMFLVNPKPQTEAQVEVFKKLANDELEAPDTWEVALSAGAKTKSQADKCSLWTDLLERKKLGAMALLRNLRNMQEVGVSEKLIREALGECKPDRVLPFRFISAAKAAPRLESALEPLMLQCMEGLPKLPGKTILVLDVSGSMGNQISSKADVTRLDTAAALAMLAREQLEDPVIYCTAGSDSRGFHRTAVVPARHGFALRDLIHRQSESLGGGGIFLRQCMDHILEQEKTADRIIVLTDEQDCDNKLAPETAPAFGATNYLINVAAHQNGIGYRKWTHIDGWSENVLQFIWELEMQRQQQAA